MPPKPAPVASKPTNAVPVKPPQQAAEKPKAGVVAAAQKPAAVAQKPAPVVNKPAAVVQKPAQTVTKPAPVVNKPTGSVVGAAQKAPVVNSAVKQAPLSQQKPGVVGNVKQMAGNHNNNKPNPNGGKVDPATAAKKAEADKKIQEEQKKLEELKKAQQEEEEKKKQEEQAKAEEAAKKEKEEAEKKEKELEEEKKKQEALKEAEREYLAAKAAEEKRQKEEQEKLKNGKINIRTNTGGMTSTVEFKIKDGCIDYPLVDDELALEYAYEKGYQFYLTAEKDKKPDESISYFSQGSGKTKHFENLQAGGIYWCVVLPNDAAESKRKGYKIDPSVFGGAKEEKRGEGCSCLYGNPCVDQYVCLDWNNRFTVAKNHLKK